MPLYEYYCKSCGERFEKIVRMDARDNIKCPHCFGDCRRAISACNFTFGFVRTWKRPGDPEGDRLVRNVSGV